MPRLASQYTTALKPATKTAARKNIKLHISLVIESS